MTTNPTPTQQGETLERCDFCADGGNPQVCQTQKYIHPGGVETDHPLYAVICQDCDARGPEENTPAKAAQRWSTRRAAVAGPRGDVLLPEWTECQSMFADGIATALSEFIRAYEPVQSTNPDDKAADEWRQALTAVLTAAEKLPLPTDYECVAPSEQVYVINLLRGICDADKQEVARLHLNLCARCQELAGGVVPAESDCTKCGGSGEIEIGCAMDHALTAPCVECRGTGTVAIAPAESARVVGEQLATEIVSTVFDNTAASHETLKQTMIERITDWLAAAPADNDAE